MIFRSFSYINYLKLLFFSKNQKLHTSFPRTIIWGPNVSITRYTLLKFRIWFPQKFSCSRMFNYYDKKWQRFADGGRSFRGSSNWTFKVFACIEHELLTSWQSPYKYFYTPHSKVPHLNKKRHVSRPIHHFSGTEVPILWFADIIYKIIQNFRLLKTCLSHYNFMILHLKTFSNMLY